MSSEEAFFDKVQIQTSSEYEVENVGKPVKGQADDICFEGSGWKLLDVRGGKEGGYCGVTPAVGKEAGSI